MALLARAGSRWKQRVNQWLWVANERILPADQWQRLTNQWQRLTNQWQRSANQWQRLATRWITLLAGARSVTTDKLKKDFDKAMLQIYVRAEKEANYRATIFHQMLNDYGGLQTAKKLLASGSKVSAGYTSLWERRRLDLTVEALVVQPPWMTLFSAEEIETAKSRLREYEADPKLIDPDTTLPASPQRIEWSKEALELCVREYFEMLHASERGESLSKADTFQELSKATGGHSAGSVRNLFQNISYELDQRGLKTIPGISGLSHPSGDLRTVVAAHLDELFIANTEDEISQKEPRVRCFVRVNSDRPPAGNANPQRKELSGRQYIVRDLQVGIYVKAMAAGKCELCQQDAPFHGRDGEPYLEIHHVRTLADGGPDVPSNTVALCPNCHKAVHFGTKSENLREILYSKIKRLLRE